MDFNVKFTDRGNVGTISCQICSSSMEAQRPVLGGIDCPIRWFEQQIPFFSYPAAVLSNIAMDNPRRGDGRQTMRAFHRWASRHGALFAFLRIGTQGDDFCQGVRWRRRFYKSEGWTSLRRPRLPHLVLHWMYRRLDPEMNQTEDCNIVFEEDHQRLPFLLPIRTK